MKIWIEKEIEINDRKIRKYYHLEIGADEKFYELILDKFLYNLDNPMQEDKDEQAKDLIKTLEKAKSAIN